MNSSSSNILAAFFEGFIEGLSLSFLFEEQKTKPPTNFSTPYQGFRKDLKNMSNDLGNIYGDLNNAKKQFEHEHLKSTKASLSTVIP